MKDVERFVEMQLKSLVNLGKAKAVSCVEKTVCGEWPTLEELKTSIKYGIRNLDNLIQTFKTKDNTLSFDDCLQYQEILIALSHILSGGYRRGVIARIIIEKLFLRGVC